MPISPSPGISQIPDLRLATLDDFEKLVWLENECFEEGRRDNPETIKRGLENDRHEIWILRDDPNQEIGMALFLRQMRNTLRIYSLSTLPRLRGQGWGNHLLAFARKRARARNCTQISLEADASIPMLIAWYERKGFQRVKLLKDYYGHGRDAWRMKSTISQDE